MLRNITKRFKGDRGSTSEVSGLEYSPLNTLKSEIRLAIIEPGKTSSVIRCRMVHVFLDDKPIYEALSYTWGDQSHTKKITINNCVFDVGENLLAALHGLRTLDRQRTVWIDAICINQKDIPERESQVRIMRRVYQEAKQVAIWLGDGLSDGDLAMGFLQELHQYAVADDELTFQEAGQWIGPMINDTKYLPRWKALYGLLTRPYWKRVWIVQEIISATSATIYYGHSSIPFKEFSRAISELVGMNSTINEECQEYKMRGNLALTTALTERISVIDMFRDGSGSLLEFLLNFRGSAATNDQDQVFAYLGMIKKRDGIDSIDPLSLVNLHHSQKDAYINAVRLGLEQSLDIICLSQPHCSNSNLPSWVPDWTVAYDAQPLYFKYKFGELQGADGQSFQKAKKFKASIEGDILVVQGIQVDTVKYLGNPVENWQTKRPPKWDWNDRHMGKYEKKNYSTIFEWSRLALSPKPNHPHFSTPAAGRSIAFWRTLIHNRHQGGRPANPRWSEWADDFLSCGDANTYRRRRATGEVTTNPFQQSMMSHSAGRRFAISETGLFGSVPTSTKIGDRFFVLIGSRIPVVLRQVGGRWTFIGDCYLHGYMEGKATERATPTEFRIY